MKIFFIMNLIAAQELDSETYDLHIYYAFQMSLDRPEKNNHAIYLIYYLLDTGLKRFL